MHFRELLATSFFLLCFIAVRPAIAEPDFTTKASQVYLVEARTGAVLYAKGEEELVAPGSAAKLMTVEYILNLIEDGTLKPETTYEVSEYAWRTGGALSRTATMFAGWRTQVPVADLLRGAMALMANDACLILAEGTAGSDEKFAEKLNERAKAIGLRDSYFGNSTGFASGNSRVSMRDLVKLAIRLKVHYPDYYANYALPAFEWNGIRQLNKNPLLGSGLGVDGLVAGYDESSGYLAVASAKGEGMELVLAIAGLDSEKTRKTEAERLIRWAFETFSQRLVFKSGENVTSVSVYGGNVGQIPVSPRNDVYIFEDRINPERVSAKVAYKWPLKAPIGKEDQIAELRIYNGDHLLQREPLFADASAGQGSLAGRSIDALVALLFSWLW